MKKKILIIVFTVLLLLGYFVYQTFQTAVLKAKKLKIEADVLDIVVKIEELRQKLTPYPPSFKDEKDKKETTDKIELAVKYSKILLNEALANKFISKNTQAKILWEIGELYRLEHNLDLKDAWKNSEDNLKQAIETDPSYVNSYLSLGMLYINTDLSKASDAELLFLTAKNLTKSDFELRAAYSGLWFAYYYQFRIENALEVAKEALKKFPNDEEFLSDLKITETVLNRKK